jgi:hypothetical protein
LLKLSAVLLSLADIHTRQLQGSRDWHHLPVRPPAGMPGSDLHKEFVKSAVPGFPRVNGEHDRLAAPGFRAR